MVRDATGLLEMISKIGQGYIVSHHEKQIIRNLQQLSKATIFTRERKLLGSHRKAPYQNVFRPREKAKPVSSNSSGSKTAPFL